MHSQKHATKVARNLGIKVYGQIGQSIAYIFHHSKQLKGSTSTALEKYYGWHILQSNSVI